MAKGTIRKAIARGMTGALLGMSAALCLTWTRIALHPLSARDNAEHLTIIGAAMVLGFIIGAALSMRRRA